MARQHHCHLFIKMEQELQHTNGIATQRTAPQVALLSQVRRTQLTLHQVQQQEQPITIALQL